MVIVSPTFSVMLGTSAHEPEIICGVNERFAGVRAGSKFNTHEKICPLSAAILSVILIVQLPLRKDPNRLFIDSSDE